MQEKCMTEPRGEGQPNFEDQAGRDADQSLTLEGSKDSQKSIVPHKERKKDGIAKQLTDREATISEDRRLVHSLAKAEEILRYFETRSKLGLPISEKDITELEDAKAVVASLSVQKETTLQEYKTIMSDPVIYERVWEEAKGEEMAKDALKDRASKEKEEEYKRAKEEIIKKVSEISDAIGQFFLQIELRAVREKSKKESVGDAASVVNRVLLRAKEILGQGKYGANEFLHRLFEANHSPHENTIIDELKQYRRELDSLKDNWLVTTLRRVGLTTDKEKAAIDVILREEDLFEAAVRQVKELSSLQHDHEIWRSQQTSILAQQLKTLMLEAWARENEIQRKYPTQHYRLPDFVFREIGMNLNKIADFVELKNGYAMSFSGEGEVESKKRMGIWWEPDREKNSAERRLNSLFQSIVLQAGGESLWRNPESEKQEKD